MTVIKKGSSPKVVKHRLEEHLQAVQKKHKAKAIHELCGSVKLKEKPLELQKQWRDEWK
jgi:hypothetical protein